VFKLPLAPAEGVSWEAKHTLVITFRCVLFIFLYFYDLFRPLTLNPQSEIPTRRCHLPTIRTTMPTILYG
jgi:hypothetical protein